MVSDELSLVPYDAVIVGAGIGGLSAAWRLRRRRILVLEADDRVGGRIRSETRGQYWLNFGAHLFGDNNSPAGRLVDEFKLEARSIPGDRMGFAFRGRLVAGGRSETFPLRLPLSFAGRVSFVRLGLKLRKGVLRLLESQRDAPRESLAERRFRQLSFENARTLADYVGPLHPEIDSLLRTMTERTSATPDTMAAGYGLTSFAQVWSKYSFGRNLFGGSSRLPLAIAEQLSNRIRLLARVCTVTQRPNDVEVIYYQNGRHRRVVARHVIVATPANVAGAIIRDLPADTSAALSQIPYGPFLSAAVLTKEARIMPFDGNYAIATPGLTFGVFFNQASILRTGPRKPGGSLMLFRGAEGAASLLDLSDPELEQRMLTDLYKLFPETQGTVREIAVQRWPRGAPYSFPGRATLQPALARDLGKVRIAGDYLEFPCMDAAISTATEAAEAVEAALKGPG
jgi:protoporphyrinogen/coproporphyrinogen III oxidase